MSGLGPQDILRDARPGRQRTVGRERGADPVPEGAGEGVRPQQSGGRHEGAGGGDGAHARACLQADTRSIP